MGFISNLFKTKAEKIKEKVDEIVYRQQRLMQTAILFVGDGNWNLDVYADNNPFDKDEIRYIHSISHSILVFTNYHGIVITYDNCKQFMETMGAQYVYALTVHVMAGGDGLLFMDQHWQVIEDDLTQRK